MIPLSCGFSVGETFKKKINTNTMQVHQENVDRLNALQNSVMLILYLSKLQAKWINNDVFG